MTASCATRSTRCAPNGKTARRPRQLFALGYGGNGMTLGFFAAQAIVRLAQARPGPDDELFGFGRRG